LLLIELKVQLERPIGQPRLLLQEGHDLVAEGVEIQQWPASNSCSGTLASYKSLVTNRSVNQP
jgi:hypothetical protein